MDLISIGKFISEQRKLKGYSQVELANKLNISNKTISKWERGNGFPDVSLLLPLCEELDISVNELLSAKKLQESEYHERAEENLIQVIGRSRLSPQERSINKILTITLVIWGVLMAVLTRIDFFKSSIPALIALLITTIIFLLSVGAIWSVTTITLKDFK